MRGRKVGATLVVVWAVALSACGGSGDEGDTQGSTEATPGEGSFAVYDWEPNVVAQPGAKDPSGTGMGKAEAEQLAANNPGTIVLLEPLPYDIPTTKFDESKGATRKYYVLRDRPALEQSDVESATVQSDSTGQTSIIVNLTPDGAQKLGDLNFKQARRGSTPPPGPLGGLSIGPRSAIVVGDEILQILQLGPGRYTRRPVPAITVVGFEEERAQELADAIDPGSDTAATVTLGAG